MIRNMIILVALLVSVGAYTYYADFSSQPVGQTNQTSPLQSTGQKAPDFTFKDLQGKTHRLEDFRGKVVILNFWASWCAPCVIEFPQMLQLAKKTQDKAVFIFMSVNDNQQDIDRFLKKYKNHSTIKNVFIAKDTDKFVSQNLYQTYKLPETYVLSQELKIKEKIIGLQESWDSPSMYDRLFSF